ncbi:GNAT family N-acetyltransferase [Streptococcus loxodontisalivarius]|uniref:RimJ/RimL family protein N-acetyltransferase n=1 Tax=Streptococcus loxodontisalivarius TaxID=1349415 RepID=A0ABS2PVZ2_9STRE|nr:GNAT family N-acetyltransferase [Streptococcus loxodontisalivarius]MBM7643462.1 RimJ/RimL family protein N-acetyltransferase [Streptococcus loxodontisalivarius]
MAEQEVLFGEAEVSDAKALLDFLDKVGEQSDFIDIDESGMQMSLAQMEESLSYRLESTNNICLIAKLGERVIAMLNVAADFREQTRHIGDIFIVVDKDYWGYGLGQTLMDLCLDWAQETEDISRLELTVQARNERAVHVYQKFGFEIEGVKKRGAKLKDGEFLDVYLMGKLID